MALLLESFPKVGPKQHMLGNEARKDEHGTENHVVDAEVYPRTRLYPPRARTGAIVTQRSKILWVVRGGRVYSSARMTLKHGVFLGARPGMYSREWQDDAGDRDSPEDDRSG